MLSNLLFRNQAIPISITISSMAKTNLPIFFLFMSLTISAMALTLVDGQKTWCVAKPSTDAATLESNINFACSQVDCKILQKGSPCFVPDNLMNHASIAMNLYFEAKGRFHWDCHFGNSALVVMTDPSYGSCIYN